MTDLNKMAGEMLASAEQRERNGANISTDTYHMLKHCATEVVEAADAWAKYKAAEAFYSYELSPAQFISELADIIACCLIIAGKEQIDIEDALVACQKKNRLRAEGKGDKK